MEIPITSDEFIVLIIYLISHKFIFDFILMMNTQKLEELVDENDIFRSTIKNKLEKLEKRFLHFLVVPLLIVVLTLPISKDLRWDLLGNASYVRTGFLILMGLFTLKYTTMDNDIAIEGNLWVQRLSILISYVISFFYFPFASVFFFCALYYFHGWQHHNHMPIRLLHNIYTLLLALGIYKVYLKIWSDVSHFDSISQGKLFVWVLCAIYASHYWVPYLKKLLISSKAKKSWMFNNQLSLMVPAAYFYGWLRFVSEKTMFKLTSWLKPFNIPMQIYTILLELGIVLLLVDQTLSFVLISLVIAMHLMIFVTSGLLFWEYISANCILIYILKEAYIDVGADLYGIGSEIVFLALSGITALIGLVIWRPKGLGWWESPLSSKVNWVAIGESGKRYGIYNKLMAPHDRIFGRIYGRFLVDSPFLVGHLGQCKSLEISNLLIDYGDNIEKINTLITERGVILRNTEYEKTHDEYFKSFFNVLNQGVQKNILPRGLRFIKPPIGQLYLGGDLPVFDYQEKVVKVEVYFKESIILENKFLDIRNVLLKTIEIAKN